MPKLPSKKTQQEERPVLYPNVDVRIHQGADALTAQDARELLGWTEETDEVKLGDNYHFKDENNKKVLCRNNTRNRPLDINWARALAQDILNKHWRFNLETIIIGRTGLTLSGQHRLIGLVLAAQQWALQKQHWEKNWPTEPTIETLVAYGADERSDFTKTIDNVKPRGISDVLFCGDEFASYKAGEREKVCNLAGNCIRMLWKRTGANNDAFSPYRTNSESLDFLQRHGKIKAAVKHIYEENSDGTLSGLLTPGYASALLYLMAAGNTDGDVYRNTLPPSEKKIDFTLWNKAEEFWVLLAKGGKELNPLRVTVAKMVDPTTEDGRASKEEVVAVFAKAWALFSTGDKLTEAKLALEYQTDEDGVAHLINAPTFGGIDLDATQADAVEHQDSGPPTSKEELEAAKAAEKKKALDKLVAMNKAKVEAKKNSAAKVEGLTEAGKKAAAAQGVTKPSGKAPTKVQQAQTAKAKAADEALAAEKAAVATAK